ncbi:MAG: hypothetical protein RDU30_00965 [Desulfovibrionaceae bacterium]|nr:hypothetical protein [Desulfovibrionaceae bacterium]
MNNAQLMDAFNSATRVLRSFAGVLADSDLFGEGNPHSEISDVLKALIDEARGNFHSEIYGKPQDSAS